jgi:hypothetical protein
MWTYRAVLAVVEQRCFHSPPSSSSTLSPVAPSTVWMRERMDAALSAGKITKEAYDYFNITMCSHKGTQNIVDETHRAMDGQNPQEMTKFQQSTICDRVVQVGAIDVASKLQGMLSEEKQLENYSKDGTPTGESYWFEESSLLDPNVPSHVKDDIMNDIQRSRRPDSPAFGIVGESNHNHVTHSSEMADLQRESAGTEGAVMPLAAGKKKRLSFGPA